MSASYRSFASSSHYSRPTPTSPPIRRPTSPGPWPSSPRGCCLPVSRRCGRSWLTSYPPGARPSPLPSLPDPGMPLIAGIPTERMPSLQDLTLSRPSAATGSTFRTNQTWRWVDWPKSTHSRETRLERALKIGSGARGLW